MKTSVIHRDIIPWDNADSHCLAILRSDCGVYRYPHGAMKSVNLISVDNYDQRNKNARE